MVDCRNMAQLAWYIAGYVERRNPILRWGITALLPDENGTKMVMVQRAGQSHPAIYLPPTAPVVNGGVFVTMLGGSGGQLFVYATDFQNPWTPDYAEVT